MVDTVALASGQKMPAVGFGTWKLPDGAATAAVRAAIAAGYRLFDTARIYDNEAAVGQAIRDAGVARDACFVVTKVWNDDQGYDTTLAACDASLERLGMSYVDLYLIHWPATSRRGESWRALVELQRRGTARAIGVSNYTVRHLRELLSDSPVVPAVNQVEFHPFIYEQQRPLLQFCREHRIVVQGYSPLARLAGQRWPAIERIAKRVGRTPAQVVLRWCLQHGVVPLPRSQNPGHIRSNLAVFDFVLDGASMHALDGLSDGHRVTWDPAGMR